jgi:hypothetical protein
MRSDSGIPDGWRYWSSTIDPGSSSTLYTSTNLGVYRTNNHGESWQQMEGSEVLDLGFPGDQQGMFRNIVVDPLRSHLLLGTMRGLYAYNLITSVRGEEELPLAFHLYQNYPNPFNPTTTIRYALPERVFVHLGVYDVLGKEVASLVKEEQNPGTYTVEFNGDGLPSGVYYYRLTAGRYNEVKKMIMLK